LSSNAKPTSFRATKLLDINNRQPEDKSVNNLFMKSMAVCGGIVIGITVSILLSSSLAAWTG
jgi:hypothetical protein